MQERTSSSAAPGIPDYLRRNVAEPEQLQAAQIARSPAPLEYERCVCTVRPVTLEDRPAASKKRSGASARGVPGEVCSHRRLCELQPAYIRCLSLQMLHATLLYCPHRSTARDARHTGRAGRLSRLTPTSPRACYVQTVTSLTRRTATRWWLRSSGIQGTIRYRPPIPTNGTGFPRLGILPLPAPLRRRRRRIPLKSDDAVAAVALDAAIGKRRARLGWRSALGQGRASVGPGPAFDGVRTRDHEVFVTLALGTGLRAFETTIVFAVWIAAILLLPTPPSSSSSASPSRPKHVDRSSRRRR